MYAEFPGAINEQRHLLSTKFLYVGSTHFSSSLSASASELLLFREHMRNIFSEGLSEGLNSRAKLSCCIIVRRAYGKCHVLETQEK